MENKQEILNAIATLSASIDPLLRADKKEAIETVVTKLCDYVGKLD